MNADLERCFADAPEGVARNDPAGRGDGYRRCLRRGLDRARRGAPIYRGRPRAGARRGGGRGGARRGARPHGARSENYLHGRRDLADTIARLQSFEAAGADVLYAPGLTELAEIETLVQLAERAGQRAVHAERLRRSPSWRRPESARISVGSTFYNAAMGALVEAAREWREQGTHAFWQRAMVGMGAIRSAFER